MSSPTQLHQFHGSDRNHALVLLTPSGFSSSFSSSSSSASPSVSKDEVFIGFFISQTSTTNQATTEESQFPTSGHRNVSFPTISQATQLNEVDERSTEQPYKAQVNHDQTHSQINEETEKEVEEQKEKREKEERNEEAKSKKEDDEPQSNELHRPKPDEIPKLERSLVSILDVTKISEEDQTTEIFRETYLPSK